MCRWIAGSGRPCRREKERYVKPLLTGDIFAAECLTEPRGGSDFFGATSTAEEQGDHFLHNGQKRFIVVPRRPTIFWSMLPALQREHRLEDCPLRRPGRRGARPRGEAIEEALRHFDMV
jgi:alkylation response protein AidB-like acyl-CoA dehydrogenase